MAFYLSNENLIIQYNTDNDLSALSSIDGVTTIQSGGVTIYDIGDRQLDIYGTLFHDPDYETLITSFTVLFNGVGSVQVLGPSGVYNYGKTYIGDNGIVGYSSGTGIISNSIGLNGSRFPGFGVGQNGTLNWSGGVISLAAAFSVETGAYLNILSGTMNNINPNTSIQLRLKPQSASDNSRISVNGLTMTGPTRGCVLFTTNAWDSMVCNFENARVQTYNNTQPTLIIDNPDLSKNRLDDFVNFNMGVEANTSEVRLFNPSGEVGVSQANSKFGIASSWRAVELNTFLAEAPTSTEVAYYAKDSDSGNRITVNSIGYLSDQTYNGVTTSGSANLGNILIQVASLKSGEIVNVDPRWSNGTLPLNVWGYGYQYAQVDIPLYGNFKLDVNVNMVSDESITEADKAIVLAYATLETPQKLYDRSIAEIFPTEFSYLGQTLSTITRDGDLINARALNVVIDPNAVSAYSLTGTTLTFKSILFEGAITTTGTITRLGGARATGALTDASGTTLPDKTLTVQVNQTGADVFILEAGTNTVIASVDAQSGNDFEYVYVGAQYVDIGVVIQGYTPKFAYNYYLAGENQTLPVQLLIDRAYS